MRYIYIKSIAMERIDNYINDFENWEGILDYFEGIDYDDYDIVDRKTSIKDTHTSYILSNFIRDKGKLGVNEAKELIKMWHIKVLVKSLQKFEWLDSDIANILIKNGHIKKLAKSLFSFQNLDKNTAKILSENRIGAVASNLSAFVALDDEIAQILIKNKYYDAISWNIDKFENLSNETLIALLVNCTKHKWLLIKNNSKFPNLLLEKSELLFKLKKQWRNIEYSKLKEFYEKIDFEEARENFQLYNKFDRYFNILDAQKALEYWEWRLIIKNLNNFRWKSKDFEDLINLLLDWKYIEDIKNLLPKLRWKNLNWHEIVHKLSETNNYNTLINYADSFEHEEVLNIEMAEEIIENCDVDCWDCVTKLSDYSDEKEEWEWINYNLDFSKAIRKGKKDFMDLLDYFKLEFSPSSSNRKLPLKLKEIVKEKFWLNIFLIYKDLFKSKK